MNLYKNTQAPANTMPKNIRIALQMNLVRRFAFSEHAMGTKVHTARFKRIYKTAKCTRASAAKCT